MGMGVTMSCRRRAKASSAWAARIENDTLRHGARRRPPKTAPDRGPQQARTVSSGLLSTGLLSDKTMSVTG
eukprot:6196830-Pleurochrysis_carterae.AAC.6